MKSVFKIAFGVLLLPLITGVSLWQLNEQGFFNLTQVEFLNSDQTAPPEYLLPFIQSVDSRLDSFKGKSLFEINLNEMHQQIAMEKWVNNLEIYRQWPNKLKILIQTHDVVLLYWNKKNQVQPILENSEMLEPLKKNALPDRAIVFDAKIATKTSLRRQAVTVIKSLPKEGPLSQATVAELGYDTRDGFWLKLIKKDLLVKMGDEKFDLKTNRVSHVLEYLDSKQIDARVIDANLSQKVLVRLRKGP